MALTPSAPALAALLCLAAAAAASAAGEGAGACRAGANGACGRPTTQLERDHSLIQLDRNFSALAAKVASAKSEVLQSAEASDEPSAEAQPCEPWRVTRRRRNAAMCSCRRRSGRSELPSGMRCDEAANVIVEDGAPPRDGSSAIGWSTSGQVKAAGSWCQVEMPAPNWNLKACPVAGGSTPVKVLTYNLYWWNLFGKRHGNGRSAGAKIASTSGPEGYDLMGFQECDDMSRILGDAHAMGLDGDYELMNGGRALAIAWRRSRFTWLAEGKGDVGEDHHSQYYGKRAAQWVRLLHRGGRTVFFLNHHGPLPVSHSGGCTGSATAYNILKMIATHAHDGDLIVVVGDFNAQPHSSRIQTMDAYLNRAFSGSKMGSVDHVFSNCAAAGSNNLGTGGSDHDALNAIFQI